MPTIVLRDKSSFAFKNQTFVTDYHFVGVKVQQAELEVIYIPTNDQTADVLTKGLHSPSFVRHC